MNKEQITAIETALGFRLPEAYTKVVLDYPESLKETEAPDFGLLDDPNAIVDANLDVRKNGYFGETWPEQYIIIGQNGCGDYHVITKDATEFATGFSDHEAMECNPYASDVDDFVRKLLEEMKDD